MGAPLCRHCGRPWRVASTLHSPGSLVARSGPGAGLGCSATRPGRSHGSDRKSGCGGRAGSPRQIDFRRPRTAFTALWRR
jgi:hypothetical protein